jgi:hypothetical protein
MKFLITQFSPASFNFLHLRYIYFPQHSLSLQNNWKTKA